MILKHGQTKRAGIYLFFDKQGVVDRYITEMIRDLKHSIDYLLVVCNGYVSPDGMRQLKQVSDKVICRANVGFDLGAYRDGILYLGYRELEQYDEIVFINYTFFGPIGSFDRMFETMEPRDVAFWGITKHHRVDPDPFKVISYGYLPEHIQSHFIAVRKDLFMSYEYRDFMMNRSNPGSYIQAICSYEAIFTKHFADLDYKWSVYCDTSEYEKVSFYPVMFKTLDMIERQDCPIMKRRAFFTNYDDFLYNTGGEPTVMVYDRLAETGEYDTDLLWDNLLRLENLSCLHRNMHLDYMADPREREVEPDGTDACLFLAACPAEDLVFYRRMLAAIAGSFRTIVLSGTKEETAAIRETVPGMEEAKEAGPCRSYAERIRTAAETGKDSGLMLFLDLSGDPKRRAGRLSGTWNEFAQLAENRYAAADVFRHFRKHKRLGMLVSPVFLAGDAFRKNKQQWFGRFAEVKKRLSGLQPPLNFTESDNTLFSSEGGFWIRTDLLAKCAEELNVTDDREMISMILPLFVQHYGSYTGRVFNNERIPKVLEEQTNLLRESNQTLFRLYGSNIHITVRENIKNDGPSED